MLDGLLSGRARILDLSYAIRDALPSWPGDELPFRAQVNATVEKDGYFTRRFEMLEHFGTHLDAPVHFPPGEIFVDEIPPERFFGPAVVLEARDESARDADYLLAPAKLAAWESRHGRVPRGAIALMRTGWAARWPDPALYRNQDANGVMHFPGFSVEAADLLISRGASGLGIDTLNVDFGASRDFPVHRRALGSGLYQLENLADLSALPESGAFLVVAPMKLAGGSGGPCRVFAIIP